jgi:hypothetical protein
MIPQEIQDYVKQQIQTAAADTRFQLAGVTRHVHNGTDSPKITQSNVLPGFSSEGSIEFAQTTTYKIGITFNPTTVQVHGNVIGASGEKFLIVGNAKLGPSSYMQPGTTTSVIAGPHVEKIIQSTSYFGADSAGTLHTLVDEGHIVDVFYAATVHARATIVNYDSNAVYVQVDTLASGWTINLSWTIS